MPQNKESDPSPEPEVELKVNGKKIELNRFVKQIIYHTVAGMVTSLKGVESVREISLKLTGREDVGASG